LCFSATTIRSPRFRSSSQADVLIPHAPKSSVFLSMALPPFPTGRYLLFCALSAFYIWQPVLRFTHHDLFLVPKFRITVFLLLSGFVPLYRPPPSRSFGDLNLRWLPCIVSPMLVLLALFARPRTKVALHICFLFNSPSGARGLKPVLPPRSPLSFVFFFLCDFLSFFPNISYVFIHPPSLLGQLSQTFPQLEALHVFPSGGRLILFDKTDPVQSDSHPTFRRAPSFSLSLPSPSPFSPSVRLFFGLLLRLIARI